VGLIAQLALVLSLGATGWTEGRATLYAPGKMERVAALRSMSVVPCMVAHPSRPIGTWLWVIGRQTGVMLKCRVTDTSQPWDRARHMRTGLIELDYASAKAICPKGWTGNSRECEVRWK
jgi:hypothetical protein